MELALALAVVSVVAVVVAVVDALGLAMTWEQFCLQLVLWLVP